MTKLKRIEVTMNRLGQSPKIVKAMGSPNWAYCIFDKDRSLWQVLHVQSGLSVDHLFNSKEQAIYVVQQLTDKPHLLPEYDPQYDKWIVTPDQYKEHIAIIRAAKEWGS